MKHLSGRGCIIAASLLLLSAPSFAQVTTSTPLFDVASVRQNKTNDKASLNVSPPSGDDFVPTKGVYSGRNIVLVSYISFAYKLTNRQLQSIVAQVPWIADDRFDIEARAEGNPTKDQYRQMLQTLLKERFKLAVHFETREVPIFALVLARPGTFGPQLRLHQADDPHCLQHTEKGATPAEDGFPAGYCGGIAGMVPSTPGRMKEGARNVPISLMASQLAGVGNVGRPMQDETGISGNVDFVLEWAKVAANVPPGVEFHPDENAPAFETALKEQLGMKLVPKKGPAQMFVIDHLEHPDAN
jgi:uncharacterized protein (TIGR03435 family)